MATPPAFIGFATLLAVFFAAATAALGLRLWVRCTITHSIARDDYTLVSSHLINLAAATVWLHAHIYAARFAPDSAELSSYISLKEVVATGLVLTASALNKASIASFFLKIAHKRWQRWAILAPLGMYILFLVMALLLIFFRCGLPINGHRIVTALDCPLPRDIFNTIGCIVASLNSLCDWADAFVPLHMVRKATRMDRTSKISASVLIMLAISGSFISAARIPIFAKGDSFEPTTIYATAPILLLSVVENSVGVGVISVATLKPLLGMIRHGSRRGTPELGVITIRRGVQGESSSNGEEKRKSRNFTPDWSFMRGIGILPDVAMERSIRFSDEESRYSNDGGTKLPSKVQVKVSVMPSIDEVVLSGADIEMHSKGTGTDTTFSTDQSSG